MNKKIAIIGSGALGTALANVLFDSNQKNITIYGIDEVELNDLKAGKNTKYFKDIEFPKFKTTNILSEALKDTEYIVLAIPTIALDDIVNSILKNINSEVTIINGCKGFYPKTTKSIHEYISEKTKNNKLIKGVVTLTGPSFATEIARKSLTSILVVSDNECISKEIQKLFNCSYFKLFIQNDIIGAEVGGIYKNVLAIGSGMLHQLGYKINTVASYLTLGMKEMQTLNKFFGGKYETIYGLSGLGDLILTATSNESRNFSFGKEFIINKENALSSKKTIEGLVGLKNIEKIRKENNLNLPIASNLYEIIFNNKNVNDSIKELWNLISGFEFK